jgi:hypothetical protein
MHSSLAPADSTPHPIVEHHQILLSQPHALLPSIPVLPFSYHSLYTRTLNHVSHHISMSYNGIMLSTPVIRGMRQCQQRGCPNPISCKVKWSKKSASKCKFYEWTWFVNIISFSHALLTFATDSSQFDSLTLMILMGTPRFKYTVLVMQKHHFGCMRPIVSCLTWQYVQAWRDQDWWYSGCHVTWPIYNKEYCTRSSDSDQRKHFRWSKAHKSTFYANDWWNHKWQGSSAFSNKM